MFKIVSDTPEAPKTEITKKVVTSLINYHYSNQQSPLRQITTEFITPTDYGGGFKYSVFENNVACAKWIKKSIKEIKLNLHNT